MVKPFVNYETFHMKYMYYFFNKIPVSCLFLKACLSHFSFLLLFLSQGLFTTYQCCANGALLGADDNQLLAPFHNTVQQSENSISYYQKSSHLMFSIQECNLPKPKKSQKQSVSLKHSETSKKYRRTGEFQVVSIS